MIHTEKSPVHERGDTLMLCIVCAVLFFALLATGFDLPHAMMKKTEQESALNLAREAEMTPAIGIVAKNADDPGLIVAKELVRSMRTGGYTDAIEIWFYEVDARSLPPTKRVFAYEVIVKSTLNPLFAQVIGAGEINVASSMVSTSMPYSDVKAWRPSSVRSGLYSTTPNSDTLNFAGKTLEQMPGALKRELAISVEDANKE